MGGQHFDLEGLGRSIAAAQDRLTDPDGSDESVRWKIADAAAARPRPRFIGPRMGIAAASVVIVAGFATALLRARSGGKAEHLSFTVGDPPMPGRTKELLSAPERSPILLHFSEGTTLTLQPRARGRILDVTDRGAEVLLERGHARFEVEHRPQARWQVRSGSFLIQVVGTKFETDYDPRTEELAVTVDEGSVVVSGCDLGAGRIVRTRERVQASCLPRTVSVRAGPDASGSVPAEPPEQPRAPPSSEVIQRDGTALRGEGVRRTREPRGTDSRLSGNRPAWVDLARDGRYVEAWDRARASFARECQRGGASELWLLGDTARLTGHGREGRRAYQALRERFRGTTAAADAAFALGRLAFEIDGDSTEAERWFETHLGERPDGPLARSALGRIMDLRVDRGDRLGAAGVAREYLRRFPRGPRASAARALLEVTTGAASTVDPAR
jgi:hypothetical protein